MFYGRKVVFIISIDDSIFAFLRDASTNQNITDTGAKFEIEYQWTLYNYIRVNIEYLPSGKIKLSQIHLIDQIVQDVNLAQRAPTCSTPDKPSMILRRDISAPPFENRFYYSSVFRNIGFIDEIT